ncbi:MAG: NgoFVII family restriction endonuclease [Campylobacteraceae bacterium]|nr:NgoFVII family restriction endonuclease [Campylobacteraceae bacterium]
MYTNIFTNNKDFGGNFLNEFESKLDVSTDVMIATGYFGVSVMEDLREKLIKLSKKGSCKILIGMVFHSGVTLKQKNFLKSIDTDLRNISSDNGIYISMKPYHGKLYKFGKDENKDIFIGSSNFSKEGLKSRYECTVLITDNNTKEGISTYLDDLYALNTTITLSETDLRVKGKVIPIRSSELVDYEIPESSFPDINEVIGKCDIKLRVDNQPMSSFNLYFEPGRKNSKGLYVPRPWYEVEITTTSTEQNNVYYPESDIIESGKTARKGIFNAFIKQDSKFYKIKMVVHAANGKNISSHKDSGGRITLGKIIKGRLEKAGLLKEGDILTSEILDSYGKDTITLLKINKTDYILDF